MKNKLKQTNTNRQQQQEPKNQKSYYPLPPKKKMVRVLIQVAFENRE